MCQKLHRSKGKQTLQILGHMLIREDDDDDDDDDDYRCTSRKHAQDDMTITMNALNDRAYCRSPASDGRRSEGGERENCEV